MGSFVIAENPDPESTLPYLLRFEVAGDTLILKARETWPRTSKVYCHRAEDWPPDATIVKEVPIREVARRGVAIDLVLDRRQEQRSQFVFTRLKGGREAIFWQSARTARASRPGIRMPGRPASGLEDLEIVVDSRERYAYKFGGRSVTTLEQALPVGDYAVMQGGDPVAIVERKSLQDLIKGLTDGTLAFQMADLATYPVSAVAVEGRYPDLFKHEHVSAAFAADLLARHQVRYPNVPIVFCDARKLAEEWTYRFLGAAMIALEETPDTALSPRDPR